MTSRVPIVVLLCGGWLFGTVLRILVPLLHGLESVEQTPIVAVDRGAQEQERDHEIEMTQARRLPPGHLGDDKVCLVVDGQRSFRDAIVGGRTNICRPFLEKRRH